MLALYARYPQVCTLQRRTVGGAQARWWALERPKRTGHDKTTRSDVEGERGSASQKGGWGNPGRASIMASATQRPLCGAKVSQYWGKGLSKAQVGIQKGRYGDRAPLPILYLINHIGIYSYISISPLVQEGTS